MVSAHYPPNFVSGGHPAAPAPGARAARSGATTCASSPGSSTRREPRWRPGTRRTRRASRPLGGVHALHGLVRPPELRQLGRGGALRRPPARPAPPTSCTCTPCRPSGRGWWGWRRRREPRWWSPCTTSGGCAPGSSSSTGTTDRARSWCRPAPAPARPDASTWRSGLLGWLSSWPRQTWSWPHRGRPPRCWPPTGWHPGASRWTRTGWRSAPSPPADRARRGRTSWCATPAAATP